MRPRTRTPQARPPFFWRLTFSEALAMYEVLGPVRSTHPANIVDGLWIDVLTYPNLVVEAAPESMTPEVRELLVSALAEALVSAYRTGLSATSGTGAR